jgi:hypothetical protein
MLTLVAYRPIARGCLDAFPKYVQAFVDRRNNQPRHYFRRKGYPLTALPGLPYTPEFMSAYGNALASSEELLKKAKGERPVRSVQPAAKVMPGSMAALIREFKAARFPELGEVTRENYTRLLNRLESAAGPLPVAKITEAEYSGWSTNARQTTALRPATAFAVSSGCL